ncbi:PHA/PHB synthase family protein [Sphingomonas bacterium]|uniref:PHA/PHB synthase family protein n=1 Tax=Sphingomonas bacterium TaxID=1895847 RepID=UPI00157527CB|nr:alpha/beta fold hydrolase [Sphingomonas bacterium]
MAEADGPELKGRALLDELAHWTGIIGQAQQLLIEYGATAALKAIDGYTETLGKTLPNLAKSEEGADAGWGDALSFLQQMMPGSRGGAPDWQQPLFDLFHQGHAILAQEVLGRIRDAELLDPRQREQLRFATQAALDAMNPSNFALTNPRVVERIIETRGANLVTGMQRMLEDAAAGQIRHVDAHAFELGRNIAATPGKVIYENRLFQLLHYAPTTERVDATPLLIFPPWINRFYILDLGPKKSFVRWALDQGLSVFMVSWKSADAGLADVTMDDYVLGGEYEALSVVRRLLEVPSVHVVGYCVAGTALAMLLAWAAKTGRADEIASATFFTAQVDFAQAGDLSLLVDDGQMALIDALTSDGVLDGRYMSATFNLLRGRDLIWNYVVNHYLLAEDYGAFDLLHWNSDVSNLPAEWHRRYLTDFYRDNLLARPGAMSVGGESIDLGTVATPSYVQAGREDHIAPAESVWKITHHFKGPLRFVLAGSGHIAGVVNPPAANRYGYWTNDGKVETLAAFVEGATEHAGSWWPDWRAWITERSGGQVAATGARLPGQGALAAIEDAPGRYVRTR